MAKNLQRIFRILLLTTVLSFLCSSGAFSANVPGGAQGGMPSDSGPGGPSWGGGDWPPENNSPDKAAIYLKDGAEHPSREYSSEKRKTNIKSGEGGIFICDVNIASSGYTFGNIVAAGIGARVTLDDCIITRR